MWHFPETGLGPTAVHITIPDSDVSSRRYPVLIALHGRGEALKTPEQGARGWPSDYGMLHALKRLSSPPLTENDFGQMVTQERLKIINRTLSNRPYRGLIIVSPYIPNQFGRHLQSDANIYGRFLTQTLLPKIYLELPATGTVADTAIDGVSLGGRAAIVIGLTHPAQFGAVGGIQAALGATQIQMVVRLLESARQQNPHLAFRLLSSTEDVYRDVTVTLSQKLLDAGLPHEMAIVEGNHSYEFNRGPGVFEMLLYYNRIFYP